ncbi:MAG: hypothetical protein NZ942_03460 [Candidatus Aenigmarchaeota archaeon]|nr:hypothetical protein [Candidatus Aenigmarchaeota archaeon]
MRVPTGIENLDKKIEGGIPEFSSILLVGPPGSGKTTFCNQFIYKGLSQNEAAIYILFNAPPEEVKRSMERFGWHIEGKIIVFIDVYSWQVGGIEKDTYIINNPADLNEFNIKISQAIKDLQDKNLKRCCIDAISTLYLYVPKDLCTKFSSVLFAKLKSSKITSISTVEKDVIEQKDVVTLEALTDGTIELGFDPTAYTQRVMWIRRLKDTKLPTEALRFVITDKGIVVEK